MFRRVFPYATVGALCASLLFLILMFACGGAGSSSGGGGNGGGGGGGGGGGNGGGGGAPVTVAGIFTFRGDAGRTGLNASEGTLTPANVNSTSFGKLFSDAVDGQIYAEPLYVAKVNIAGGTHNVVYVATEHASVYAFDADAAGPPLWHVNFTNAAAGITTVPSCLVQPAVKHIVPEVGVTSTPVIDSTSNTIYVVAETLEAGQPTFKLHALDITSGAEKSGSPVVIQGSVPGTSPFASDGSGHVVFGAGANSFPAIQRGALALANGTVYVTFGSHQDQNPYHGWVFAYDAASLTQTAAFNTTPNATGDPNKAGKGAIWNTSGVAADASGNLFAVSGNGTFDANTGGTDFGDSLVKLSSSLALSDWFSPSNEATLQALDKDLGSGGVLVVPDQSSGPTHLAIFGNKLGTVYVVNRDNLGHFNASGDTQIVQELPGVLAAAGQSSAAPIGPFAPPAYFNGNVYFGGAQDKLKAFSLSGGLLIPASHSAATFGYPGAMVMVSANGTSNGILWALEDTNGLSHPASCSSSPAAGPAILHAFDPANLAHELYNSNQAGSRDRPGGAIRFAMPTIANGKVYVGTQNQLTVFGLLH